MSSLARKVHEIAQLLASPRDEGKGATALARQRGPTWSWTAERCVTWLTQYPEGVSEAMLLAELEQQWLSYCESLERTSYSTIHQMHNVTQTSSAIIDLVVESALIAVKPAVDASVTVLELCDTAQCSHIYDRNDSNDHVPMFLHQRFNYLFDKGILATSSMSVKVRFTKARFIRSPHKMVLPTPWMVYVATGNNDINNCISQCIPMSLASSDNCLLHYKLRQIDESGDVLRLLEVGTQQIASFKLGEENAGLAKMVLPGDEIILSRVIVNRHTDASNVEVKLRYGPETAIIVLACRNMSDSIPQAPSITLPDESGNISARNYPSQILISDLRPRMSHITLFGRVLAVSDMNTLHKHNAIYNRVALRLQVLNDPQEGFIDVTAWDSLCKPVSRLLEGQIVLITELQTSRLRRSGQFGINSKEVACSRIYNVSALLGVLYSTCLRQLVSLEQSSTHWHFYAKCIITKYHTLGEVCLRAHVVCEKEIECRPEQWHCPQCQVEILPGDKKRVTLVYRLQLTIDDGTASKTCHVTSQAVADLLAMPASEFSRLSEHKQHAILQQAVEREVYVSVTETTSDKGGALRIECMRESASNIAAELRCIYR